MSQPHFNVREALCGVPINLRWVRRFSTSRCHHPENVAEHSYYVCFYSWMLAQVAISRECMDERESCQLMRVTLEKAVLHDVEECRTGDIHRPFKYSHSALKQALDSAAEIAMEQITERLFIQDELGENFKSVWRFAKDHSLEGRIVRLADFLSVLSFVMQEGKDAPKRLCLDTMVDHWGHFWDKANGKAAQGFELFEPELRSVSHMMQEVFSA